MKPGPLFLALALVASLLAAAAPDAAAQMGPGLKTGKKIRKGNPGADVEEPATRDYIKKPLDLVPWGATVTGRIPCEITQSIYLWTVEGTRISLRLQCGNVGRDVRAFAYFGAVGRAELEPMEKDPSVLLLEDFVVPDTGHLSIDLLCGSKLGCDFVLKTSAVWPETLTRKIKLDRDIVQETLLPGAQGRQISKVEFKSAKGSQLRVVVRDPHGKQLVQAARLRAVSGVATIYGIDVGSDGLYFLEIHDHSGTGGEIEMKVTFTNPKLFKGVKKL